MTYTGSELPSYIEHKNAVEVSAYQTPLVFTPYKPTPPQEMDAHEERDEWRPLAVEAIGNGEERVGGIGRGHMQSLSNVSVSSLGSGGLGSPGMSPALSPTVGAGRLSRQSEVSRDNTGG